LCSYVSCINHCHLYLHGQSILNATPCTAENGTIRLWPGLAYFGLGHINQRAFRLLFHSLSMMTPIMINIRIPTFFPTPTIFQSCHSPMPPCIVPHPLLHSFAFKFATLRCGQLAACAILIGAHWQLVRSFLVLYLTQISNKSCLNKYQMSWHHLLLTRYAVEAIWLNLTNKIITAWNRPSGWTVHVYRPPVHS
jgi:hypothetical protein